MSAQPTPESSRHPQRLPNQRWKIYPVQAQLALHLAEAMQLSPIISQLLVNRGVETLEEAQAFLNPESQILPSPLEEFPDLAISLELLQEAIARSQKIAICGDYDADGMTSTALLLRSLRWLGAQVDYAIPSRMHEGYGINKRIVEEFHSEGVQLILTVDNGISALEPIARARELGLKVIVTDHHDLPQKLPLANAILNPKLIAESSPYRGVAGVGVAYILAVSLAQQLGQIHGLVKPLLELFTLGTIADLAPLTGVNRRWVKRGLRQLPQSQLAGVQALIQVSGVNGNTKTLKPEDIGFRLGPRINAIGRLADPQIIIELLTTDDMGLALERAMQCEQINTRRQQLCEQIEQEAIAIVEQSQINLQQERVLVIVQPDWHHGVIGIVASRLVERYGVPVFIGTYEAKTERQVNSSAQVSQRDEQNIRGSARGIPEFNVFAALEFSQDLLGKFGGHKAAGGFSLLASNLNAWRSRLSTFANQCLQSEHLKPLLKIDTEANLNQINLQLYKQLDTFHPCGIDNPDPIFWTPNVQVIDQQIVGKGHIKLTLAQNSCKVKAIAWRWRDYFPLPPQVDIAYKLRENIWNGNTTIEMELIGARLPSFSKQAISHPLLESATLPLKAEFNYNRRQYTCGIFKIESSLELRIRNIEGQVLAIEQGKSTGFLGKQRQEAKEVDVSEIRFFNLIKAAFSALELVEKKQSISQTKYINKQKASGSEQLNLLNKQLDQLSIEQQQQIQNLQSAIQERENHIVQLQSQISQPVPLLELVEIEKKIKIKLGDAIWNHLQTHSQKDLCFAYKHYQMNRLEGFNTQIADYSEAGLRLSFAIEREIIQPFFINFYQFLLSRNPVRGLVNTTFEVGGITLKAKGRYTLGCLPPLLSNQWETFKDSILKQVNPIPSEELYYTVFFGNQVSQADRHLIKAFFQQWKHPLSQWLATGEAAASIIDQINRLRNIAAHAENLLYEWQFKALRLLILGEKSKCGVLQDIYKN